VIIDFHAHYLAQEHLQMHARTPDGRIVGASMHGQGKHAVMETNGVPLGSSCKPEDFYDLDARLEFMSATGVDIEVLSPPPFMTFTDIPGPEAARLVREQNEAIAEVVRKYPASFRGIGVAPVQDINSALQESAYLMDTLGLAGVEILTQIAGKNLDAPELDPLWQALDARHALVLIHPLDVLGAERMTRYYLRNLLGNPIETAVALASLMFGGVFERFLRIRFLAAHGGGVAPYVIGRWEHGAQVRPELVHLLDSPLALLRHTYVDSLVHGAPQLRYLVETLGADRIVLGSDTPFDMGTRNPPALFGADLPDDVRQRILGGHQDLLVPSLSQN
jgi:aminocarboxymuconate-semialdehyde decarboxylase